MQRLLLDKLLVWKQQPERKPLLVDGARQTGKTYLLESLFGVQAVEKPKRSQVLEDLCAPT